MLNTLHTSLKKKREDQGFTLIELLVVILIIGILAAITIVFYNGITSRANASAAKSTASTMQKKAELYYSEEYRDNSGIVLLKNEGIYVEKFE